MKFVLGIDPGQRKSGWCIYNHSDLSAPYSGVLENDYLLCYMEDHSPIYGEVAIEIFQGYNQPAGNTSFDSCVWAGIFLHHALTLGKIVHTYRKRDHINAVITGRKQGGRGAGGEKISMDTMIRKSLIEQAQERGIIAPYKGVSTHAWAALAVAKTHCVLQSRGIVLPLFAENKSKKVENIQSEGNLRGKSLVEDVKRRFLNN